MIPFVDLKREYACIKKEIDTTISSVLNEQQFILGKRLELFEKNFSEFCSVKYAVGVDSGTSALSLSLKALGIGRRDEVITVANSFIATAEAISSVNATPVLIDCDEKSYNIDPLKIKSKITSKTKAIIPVHLYGQTADMSSIIEIAKKYNLYIVEDACQAHGALYKGKKAGSFGDIGCFSFYPTKNIGCYGDGGIITTNNKKIYEKLKLLHNHGEVKKYNHKIKGYCNRLDEMQAAILQVKLKYIDQWNEKRRNNARIYNDELKNDTIIKPKEMDYAKHVYCLYVIRAKKRNKLQQFLKKKGILTQIHYPKPIHLHESYKDLNCSKGSFPVSERLADEVLSLPMYPLLKEDEIKQICNAINKFK